MFELRAYIFFFKRIESSWQLARLIEGLLVHDFDQICVFTCEFLAKTSCSYHTKITNLKSVFMLLTPSSPQNRSFGNMLSSDLIMFNCDIKSAFVTKSLAAFSCTLSLPDFLMSRKI